MSYCRWSTDVKNTVPWDEFMAMVNDKSKPYHWIHLKELQVSRGAEWSDWYMYRHCESGDQLGDQILAIWKQGGGAKNDGGLFDYGMIKGMYDSDNWSAVSSEITQKEFFLGCIKEWLDEVEEGYGGK